MSNFTFRPVCTIEGCVKPNVARGLCQTHYMRWNRTGDPAKLTKRPYGGGGPNDAGYWRIQVDGKSVRRHVHAAEKALGKKLPIGAKVHHVDEDRQNDSKTNLVVCPNDAYHALLHQRARAYDACGNANFARCYVCKTYSDPQTMKPDRNHFYHALCKKERDAQRYAKEKRNVVISV